MTTLVEGLVPWAVGMAVAAAAWWLGSGWLVAGRSRRRRDVARRPSGLPWWWLLARPGGWWLRCWPRLAPQPAWQRELQQRLRRAGWRDVLTPIDVRALQWSGLAVSAAVVGSLAALAGWALALPAGLLLFVGWQWPLQWLHTQARHRRRLALRALPFALDMMTLCLEGGLHFQGAVQQVIDKGPTGPLRDELQQWLGDIRAGQTRAEALRGLAQRLDDPAVRSWVQVMLQADGLGMSLGPILRAQAEQRRAERFLRAEKLALQAPVKMLFPLILCIFPCTFLVIGFPIVMHLLVLVA